ncbi:unnamed protein product [Rotaria socialis]
MTVAFFVLYAADSMAEGVENAAVVVCFLSQKYQDSENCKKELQYAGSKHISMIPVYTQRGWKPSEWLGLITAGELWIDFRDINNKKFKESAEKLYQQIQVVQATEGSVVGTIPTTTDAVSISDLTIHDQKLIPSKKPEPISLPTQGSQSGNRDILDYVRETGNLPLAYYDAQLTNTDKTVADVLDDAITGILREGATLDKSSEAEWLTKELLNLRKYGIKENVSKHLKLPYELAEMCIYIYSKSSFLPGLMTQVLNSPQSITSEQANSLGPFSWLLYRALRQLKTTNIPTVYKDLELTDEERKDYVKEEVKFTAFTETYKQRRDSECVGNTLLIIDLNVKSNSFKDQNVCCGADMPGYSNLSMSFHMWPGVKFHFSKYEYDADKQKHIIYLKSSAENY